MAQQAGTSHENPEGGRPIAGLESVFPLGASILPAAPDQSLDLRTELRHYSFKQLFRDDPELAGRILQAYHTELCKAFPDPHEREDIEELSRYLTDGGDPYDIALTLKVDLATEPEDGKDRVVRYEVVGGAQHQILSDGELTFGVNENLWVTEDSRGCGFGSMMYQNLREMMRSAGAKLIFAELNDPSIMTPEELDYDLRTGMDPHKRLQFWKKNGYRQLCAAYGQPALEGEEENEPVMYLMPSVDILDPSLERGGAIAAGVYMSLVRTYFGSFVDDLDSDPVYREIVRVVGDAEEIKLESLQYERAESERQRRLDLEG